jgi:hypothetical protein
MSTAKVCAGCAGPVPIVEVCRHLTNAIPGDVFLELRTTPKLSRHGCAEPTCPRVAVCSDCWHDFGPVESVVHAPIAEVTR